MANGKGWNTVPRRAIKPDATHMLRRYVAAIKLGHTVENASTIAGISSRSAWRWLGEGEEHGDSPAGAFSRTHKVGVAMRMTLWLGKIAEAGKGWQGAGWLAERTDKSYGRNEPASTSKTVNVLNIQVSEPQADRIAAIAAKEWAVSEGWRPAIETGGGAQHALEAAATTPDADSDTS